MAFQEISGEFVAVFEGGWFISAGPRSGDNMGLRRISGNFMGVSSGLRRI